MLLSCYDLVEFVEISRHCNTTGVWGIYFALVKSLHVAIGRLHAFLSNIIFGLFWHATGQVCYGDGSL